MQLHLQHDKFSSPGAEQDSCRETSIQGQPTVLKVLQLYTLLYFIFKVKEVFRKFDHFVPTNKVLGVQGNSD